MKNKNQLDIPEVLEIYTKCENHEILYLNPPDNRCIIYFSSHGIYYPNTTEAFTERIIHQNRFDWKKNILKSANKVVLVRDVFKQWYFKGINARLNSIQNLLCFLKKQSEDLKVICIGSSAGGYAASLFGSLLKAEYVLNFSGQFSLYDYISTESKRTENPILSENEKDSSYSQYFSLVDIIESYKVPVFYFYPMHCDDDKNQAAKIEKVGNVFSISFNTHNHSETCYPINFLDLFSLNLDQLKVLHDKFRDQPVDPFKFSISTSGYLKTFIYIFQQKTRCLTQYYSVK